VTAPVEALVLKAAIRWEAAMTPFRTLPPEAFEKVEEEAEDERARAEFALGNAVRALTGRLQVFIAEGGEWVIALDATDAAKVYEEKIGEPYMPYGKPVEWVAQPGDKMLTIKNDDEPDEKKTCAEWAATGRGHFGSENR